MCGCSTVRRDERKLLKEWRKDISSVPDSLATAGRPRIKTIDTWWQDWPSTSSTIRFAKCLTSTSQDQAVNVCFVEAISTATNTISFSVMKHDLVQLLITCFTDNFITFWAHALPLFGVLIFFVVGLPFYRLERKKLFERENFFGSFRSPFLHFRKIPSVPSYNCDTER